MFGADDAAPSPARPKLHKAVKYDMIKLDGPIVKKFELIKSIGFEGVEIDSPSGVNRQEAVEAKKQTGIQIHGVIDSVHWNQRLSDPDPAVRAAGLKALRTAIERTEATHATVFDRDKPRIPGGVGAGIILGTRWSEAMINGSSYDEATRTAREAAKGMWATCLRDAGGCGGCA